MSTEIENKARKSLQAMSTSSTIQKHLSVNRTRTLLAIDRAISGLIEEFRKVSNNNNSNQRLYDAITRADAGFSKRLLNDADRVAALEDAKQQLESIVGTEAQSRLVAQLRTDANLSESQGSDTLGFVSSGIIDAIKSELPVGAATVGSAATVSGNASAITALLNKTTPGPQHSTPTSHSEALYGTAHGTVHSAGSRAVADSGNSELMRYAVPLLLLAALLLGTMKFCSEQGKSRVIAEERNVLQQELASVQEQADKDTAKMASLESEYSATLAAAQAEKEQLQSDLQFVTTELAELRDVPTDTAELQQRLAKVTTERDEALENSLSVAEQIEAIKLERDKLNQQRELLISDLATANSTISSLNRQKTVAINQIGSLLAQRNELEENVATLTEEQLKEQQKWAKQYDTAVLNIVALEQSLSESSQEIAQLTAQRNKMQSVVDAESAKNEALTRDTLALRDTLKKKLSDAGVKSVFVKSIENDRAVAMTLGSSGLFRKGDVSLTREGGKVLGAIGKAVTDYPDWYIDVEGHTDSDPIGKKLSQRYPSNWELSSARASAVINFLRFKTDVNTEKLSARGFAETRPVADNNSPSGRNQNRRVDIILRR